MILASDEKVCGDMHLLFVFQKIFKISKRKSLIFQSVTFLGHFCCKIRMEMLAKLLQRMKRNETDFNRRR